MPPSITRIFAQSQPPIPSPRLALSVRQPHVEAILRGIKTYEYRSRPTQIRERIYIYAGKGKYTAEQNAFWLKEYGFDHDPTFSFDTLPRGVLVATAVITECIFGGRYGAAWAWRLDEVEPLEPPLVPCGRPQPIFFTPFPSMITPTE